MTSPSSPSPSLSPPPLPLYSFASVGTQCSIYRPSSLSDFSSTLPPSSSYLLNDSLSCVQWNHNLSVLLTSSYDATINFHYSSDGSALFSLTDSYPIHSLCSTQGTRYVITCGDSRLLTLWDLKRNVIVKSLDGHEDYVRSLDIIDGNIVGSGSKNGDILLHHMETGDVKGVLKLPKSVIRGSTIGSNSSDSDHPSGPSSSSVITSLQFSPHRSSQLISGDGMGRVNVYDIPSMKYLFSFGKVHKDRVSRVKCDPLRSGCVYSSSYDGEIYIHDLSSKGEKKCLKTEGWGGTMECFDIHNDGNTIIAAAMGGGSGNRNGSRNNDIATLSKIFVYDIRKESKPLTSFHPYGEIKDIKFAFGNIKMSVGAGTKEKIKEKEKEKKEVKVSLSASNTNTQNITSHIKNKENPPISSSSASAPSSTSHPVTPPKSSTLSSSSSSVSSSSPSITSPARRPLHFSSVAHTTSTSSSSSSSSSSSVPSSPSRSVNTQNHSQSSSSVSRPSSSSVSTVVPPSKAMANRPPSASLLSSSSPSSPRVPHTQPSHSHTNHQSLIDEGNRIGNDDLSHNNLKGNSLASSPEKPQSSIPSSVTSNLNANHHHNNNYHNDSSPLSTRYETLSTISTANPTSPSYPLLYSSTFNGDSNSHSSQSLPNPSSSPSSSTHISTDALSSILTQFRSDIRSDMNSLLLEIIRNHFDFSQSMEKRMETFAEEQRNVLKEMREIKEEMRKWQHKYY